MMTQKQLKSLDTKLAAIKATREKLEALEAEYNKMRLEAVVQSVSMVKKGETYGFASGSNAYTAKKNRYGRYVVKKNQEVVVKEFFGNLSDLRFLIATGKV